jgi:hypothetical protein
MVRGGFAGQTGRAAKWDKGLAILIFDRFGSEPQESKVDREPTPTRLTGGQT